MSKTMEVIKGLEIKGGEQALAIDSSEESEASIKQLIEDISPVLGKSGITTSRMPNLYERGVDFVLRVYSGGIDVSYTTDPNWIHGSHGYYTVMSIEDILGAGVERQVIYV